MESQVRPTTKCSGIDAGRVDENRPRRLLKTVPAIIAILTGVTLSATCAADPSAKKTYFASTQADGAWQFAGELAFLRKWIGKHPDFIEKANGEVIPLSPSKTLWAAPVLRDRLTHEMGADEFQKMTSLEGPEDAIKQTGPWITWQVCEEHNCPNNSYTLFVNIRQSTIEVCHVSIDTEFAPTKGEVITVLSQTIAWNWFTTEGDVIPAVRHHYEGDAGAAPEAFSNLCDVRLVQATTSQVTLHSTVKERLDVAESALASATANPWFSLNRSDWCIRSEFPQSPADLVKLDESSGVEDNVIVLKRDDAGKSLVVQVGKPQGSELELQVMFFRGVKECMAYREAQQQRLNDLK